MSSAADPARGRSAEPPSERVTDRASGTTHDQRRQIPSIDELLSEPPLVELAASLNRALVLQAARAVLERLRVHILDRNAVPAGVAELTAAVAAELRHWLAPSLHSVINATGVILHTNLGRAPLSAEAIAHICATAGEYTTLEYDLEAGSRGKRDAHTSRLLRRLTGAEAAIVVNNNAAAVVLVLAALARGGEVVVSRGELIEIGESFRIPDIMAESGAILREVGTTNRTSITDYQRALNDRTRLLLRVHRSNFQIVGFTERPTPTDLVELGRHARIPVYEDLGSGCLSDLSPWGVTEPVVRKSIEAGVDIVSFSGDKLLGGPQCGIILGQSELISRIRKHPLFRALRVDKLVIAALEATLREYLRSDGASLPTLQMIRASAAEIDARANGFLAPLRNLLHAHEATAEIIDGESVIGGGSTPAERLPTRLIAFASARHTATQLEAHLRKAATGRAVLARMAQDRLVLDLRTVFPEQEAALAECLAAALR